MDPITGAALITGGAALAEGVASSAFNAWSSSKQMDFQERMANTAHQREVEDLKKAGLNPILSSKLGGSASPPGASAQAASPDVAGKALQGAGLKAQLALIEANTNNANSAANLSKQQATKTNIETQTQLEAQLLGLQEAKNRVGMQGQAAQKLDAEIANTKAQLDVIRNQGTSSAYDLQKKKVQSKLWEIPGSILDTSKPKSLLEKGKQWLKQEWKNSTTRGKKDGATGRW